MADGLTERQAIDVTAETGQRLIALGLQMKDLGEKLIVASSTMGATVTELHEMYKKYEWNPEDEEAGYGNN